MPAEVVSLAGRDGFGTTVNVHGFKSNDDITTTYIPKDDGYQRPISNPQAEVQAPATPSTQPTTSQPKRPNWILRLKEFRRRMWTQRHEQSEAQKRRAARLEQHFADHMGAYLGGLAGLPGSG